MAAKLIIFLHGVGADGADLAPIGDLWRKNFPETRFAAPDAPFPCDMAAGRQWFSVLGVTPQNRFARVEAARASFDTVLKKIIGEAGLLEQTDQIALVGFSQGSIMALDVVATARWRFGAVVAFSGRLAPPPALTPALETPVLLIHGDDDSVIPAQEGIDAEALLRGAGVKTELKIFAGVDHCITREGAALAEGFLMRVMGAGVA
jgi:phospholipase/carboxylesterase